MSPKIKPKFYAVRKGRMTGIFRTWEETRQYVEGFSGNEHKSFLTLEDAMEYLGNETSESDDGSTSHQRSPTSSESDEDHHGPLS